MAGLFSSIPRRNVEVSFDEAGLLENSSESNLHSEGDESYNQLVDFLRQNANVQEQTEQNIAFSTLLDYLRNNPVESNTDGDITQRVIHAPELAPTGAVNIINGVPYVRRNDELVAIIPEDFDSELSWVERLSERVIRTPAGYAISRSDPRYINTSIPENKIPYDCFPLDFTSPTREFNPCNEIFIRARGPIDFNTDEITIKGIDKNTLNKFKEPESLRKEDYALAMPAKSCDVGSVLSYIYKESGESKDES